MAWSHNSYHVQLDAGQQQEEVVQQVVQQEEVREVPSQKPHTRRVPRVLHYPLLSDLCLARSADLATNLQCVSVTC